MGERFKATPDRIAIDEAGCRLDPVIGAQGSVSEKGLSAIRIVCICRKAAQLTHLLRSGQQAPMRLVTSSRAASECGQHVRPAWQ